jgi:2-hydroxy-3-keto-5-methylthiopentenyl-1-phosphate phosphatase
LFFETLGKESRKRKISNTETFADMLKTMSAKSDERLEILQCATRATGYTKFIPHLHEI